jgi:hypothetical protein
MHHRAPPLGRRSFALALAYLLALQVILAAWAVLVPTAVTALGVQTVICTTHAYGSAPSSDLPLAQCPCGPLCHAGSAPPLGAPPPEGSGAIAHPIVVAVVWHVPPLDARPHASAGPQQARAPPLTV